MLRSEERSYLTQARAMPPSVNFHLWEPCNMRCRFCLATFQDVVSSVLPKGHLPREQALRLVEQVAPYFQKITFAGGEPLLCPWLPELVRAAKARGMTTMIVTNGSRLKPALIEALEGSLDWVALSVDSASEATQAALGRAVHGQALPREHYLEVARRVLAAGMRLKVNTVVTALNAGEDMGAFIQELGPERWKVLRVLPVEGQNTGKVEPLLCSEEDFQGFVRRHQAVERRGIVLVAEDNADMRGSYAMIDPAGRFFDNTRGGHYYSEPILASGVSEAWGQVRFSMERFEQRGGRYDFGGRDE